MTKMIVFSDVHLDEDSAEVVLGKILPGIREAAIAQGINQLAMLGDFWHVRYRVDVRLQNALKDELKEWNDADLHLRILPGNHDQVDRDGRNALEVFDEMRRVQVYTDPIADGDGVWIPYRKNAEEVVSLLEQLYPQSMNIEGKRVCWVHAAVQGAEMNDHVINTDGVPFEAFAQYDSVLSGHYHKRQTLMAQGVTKPLMHYIGSVREVTSNECGQDKGYALWDGNVLQWVTMDWAPRIHKLEMQKGEQLDLSQIKSGDDVRVTAGVGVDVEEVGAILEKLGVTHTVTPVVESTQLRLDVGETATFEQYARAYVEQLAPEHADKDRLMQVFSDLVGKVTA